MVHSILINRLLQTVINRFDRLFRLLTKFVCCSLLGFAEDTLLSRDCTVGVIFVDTYIAVAALLEDRNVRIEQTASKLSLIHI